MAEDEPAKSRAKARRTERVYLQIPTEVCGEDASRRPFCERTHTLIINRDGARINSVQPLQPGQNLTIKNLQTGVSSPFRVVGSAGRSIGDAPEWGVECLEPAADIWGINFPSLEESPPEDEHVDALLECAACCARELAKLSMRDYRDPLCWELYRNIANGAERKANGGLAASKRWTRTPRRGREKLLRRSLLRRAETGKSLWPSA